MLSSPHHMVRIPVIMVLTLLIGLCVMTRPKGIGTWIEFTWPISSVFLGWLVCFLNIWILSEKEQFPLLLLYLSLQFFPIVSSSDFYFTFDSVLFCRRKIKLSEIELDFLFASSLFELPKKRPGTLILFVILGGLYSVSLMLRKPYTPLSLHCLVMY